MPRTRAAADVFSKLAKPASYTVAGSEAVDLPAGAITERDLLRTSGPFDAQVLGARNEISVLAADLTTLNITPKRGDQIETAAGTFRVESPVRNDGYIVELLVK